jgi:hypothetical protein
MPPEPTVGEPTERSILNVAGQARGSKSVTFPRAAVCSLPCDCGGMGDELSAVYPDKRCGVLLSADCQPGVVVVS